jgi:hypothetical protein
MKLCNWDRGAFPDLFFPSPFVLSVTERHCRRQLPFEAK